MTQNRVEIKLEDKDGWKQWMDCLASMCDELRALTLTYKSTPDDFLKVMDKYEFRRCDYGHGINIDWPEKK